MSKLTEARDVAGYKPGFIAEKLGITYSQFNRLENGVSKLDKLKLEKLSELYKISIEEITQIAEETFEKRVNELMEREEAFTKELEELGAANGVTN